MADRKIVFVNRFFYPDHSATSQMLSDLAFDLAASGKTVEVVTSRSLYADSTAQLPSYEVIDGVSVYRVWTSRFGRNNLVGRMVDYLTFYATAARTLWLRTDENTIVVVKTDPPLISIVAAPIVRLRGGELINWLQDLFPEVASALGVKLMKWPVLNILKHLRNMTLRMAHVNVVLGHLMEAKLVSMGVALDRICVIPNWADGASIKPVAHDKNNLRKTWNLENKFVIGYSGNLGRAHEFNTILEAADTLRHRQDIVFLFIGGGAQHAAVEKEVLTRRLSSVLFKPYVPRDQLSDSLSAVDVHLVSLNPVLEGMIVPSKFYGITAVGRPMIFIGDSAGEISLVLQECNCGYSVNSSDQVGLVNKILDFADNPDLCVKQGINARSIHMERYDRTIALKAFRKLFI
jgi:glycosyltransferase involved in cell wall biosynthesis